MFIMERALLSLSVAVLLLAVFTLANSFAKDGNSLFIHCMYLCQCLIFAFTLQAILCMAGIITG